VIDEAGEARRLLAVLRERPHSVDPASTDARRERALPRLEQHVRRVASRRKNSGRRRWVAVSLAAILSVVVTGIGIRELRLYDMRGGVAVRAVEGHLVQRVSGASYALSAGDKLMLPVEGELQTDGGSRATLETAQGLSLQIEGGSRLALSGMSPTGSDRSVELHDGQIQCAVPKLGRGERFSVVTPNARVVVHGTRFTVRVDSSEVGVTRTCVRVSEGVVAVHHGGDVATLLAGDEWGCRADERAAQIDSGHTSPMVALPAVHGSGRTGVPHRSERSPGTLAEETALLQTALAAERTGQSEVAAAALTRLLSRFPDSRLGPEARAVQKRVLHAQPVSP
jgi:hypothetical protein